MNRIQVIMTLDTEKQNSNFPEMVAHERVFINKWKEQGILENFFLRQQRNGAILIFKDIEEEKVRELINSLPLFPYMKSIEYLQLIKQF